MDPAAPSETLRRNRRRVSIQVIGVCRGVIAARQHGL
jgi:hypothetical protein